MMQSERQPESAVSFFEDIGREVYIFGERLIDRQLRLAITGLRRSGKTVFTTSFVHHLVSAHDLPFLNAAHQGRLIGAKARDFGRDAFPYQQFLSAMQGAPPRWPEPTERLTELRLDIQYRTNGWIGGLLAPYQTFEVDIIDYPGEWLLDLPLLQQDYSQFSAAALDMLGAGVRADAARAWRSSLDHGSVDELIERYRDFLATCQRELSLAFIQPGRLVHDFEEIKHSHAFCPLPAGHRFEVEMRQRFERYLTELVKPFFTEHFSTFDRQIVLVDLFTCLNEGPEHFLDTQRALRVILDSFSYGRNSWFRRLFAPRIEKVLFAASKADHVAANQHANLKQLLELMVEPAMLRARAEGIDFDVLALSAVRATDTVKTEYQGQTLSCVRGRLKREHRETVIFPGEIPSELPNAADWASGIFRFREFAPRSLKPGAVGQHIRLDQAIEFALGDKLL